MISSELAKSAFKIKYLVLKFGIQSRESNLEFMWEVSSWENKLCKKIK